MSSSHTPKGSSHVSAGTSEAPREEHVEAELRAPTTARAATPVVARTHAAAPSLEPRPQPDERQPQQPETRETIERHTVEHHTIVEMAPPPPRALPDAAPRPVTIPPTTQWLEEDRSTPDPLVATAETDALRDLMRSVRQWTSSAPTIIESPKPAAPVATDPVQSAPEPTHVSIGNVVITVEDAPVAHARGGRAAPPARTTTDRLARNHIRGG
ncbi:MAG: hypothetical protein ABI591_34045 [Kofleriaceae bacterium]